MMISNLRLAAAASLACGLLFAACDDPAAPIPDAQGPQVAITAPAASLRQAVVGATRATLRAEISDSVGVVRAAVRVNGGAAADLPVTPGVRVAVETEVALMPGRNVVRLFGYDAAGNAGADSVFVVLDQKGPLVEAKLPAQDEVTPGPVRFFVGVGDEQPIHDVTVEINGAPPVPMKGACLGTGLYACGRDNSLFGWEVTLTDLAPGPNRIVVRARDEALNETTFERVLRLVPRVVVTSPQRGTTLTSDSATVTGTVEHAADVVRVGFRVNGGAETVTPVSLGKSGAFTLRVPLVDANNVAEVVAYDAAGNAGRSNTEIIRPARSVASGPFASVSVGGSVFGTGIHVCALDRDGAAYCWGNNDRGQLGTGRTTRADAPQRVAGGLEFASISAGYHYTCGVARDGAAYCWGNNEFGQLGNGTTADAHVPARVSGTGSYRAIATTYPATCGLTTEGAVRCWGRGLVLGSDAPVCASGSGPLRCSTTPVVVPSTSRYQRLTMGGGHACALTVASTAECWGEGDWGALGRGSKDDALAPGAVLNAVVFGEISGGGIHTCGLAADGKGYCWGTNLYGELGDGTTQERLAPTPVALQERLRTIAAGSNFACALAGAGSAYCWGQNGADPGPWGVPRLVPGGVTFAALSAGGGRVCGVTTLGAVYCWRGETIAPTRVPNPS